MNEAGQRSSPEMPKRSLTDTFYLPATCFAFSKSQWRLVSIAFRLATETSGQQPPCRWLLICELVREVLDGAFDVDCQLCLIVVAAWDVLLDIVDELVGIVRIANLSA